MQGLKLLVLQGISRKYLEFLSKWSIFPNGLHLRNLLAHTPLFLHFLVEKLNFELKIPLNTLEQCFPVMQAYYYVCVIVGIFFIISLLLVSFSCCMTVLVLKIHFDGNEDKPIPIWLRRYCVIPLAKVLCYQPRQLTNKTPYHKKVQIHIADIFRKLSRHYSASIQSWSTVSLPAKRHSNFSSLVDR